MSVRDFFLFYPELEEDIMARLPDNKSHRFRFAIPSSNGKKEYIVAQQISNKEWQCSCLGWVSKHKPCKHLKNTEAERMKLEKAFGANNKAINKPPASPDDWKKAISEAIPPEDLGVEVVKSSGRLFNIKEEE